MNDALKHDSDRVRHHFSQTAESFDAIYDETGTNPLMRWVNRTFRRDMYERFDLTLGHVSAANAKSVLDVGCGSGRYPIALAKLGIERVVGLDFSDSMIQLARKLTDGDLGADHSVEYVCADFLNWPGEPFDVVVGMGLFDYFDDPTPTLIRMRELAQHSVIASFPSISIYRTPIRKARYALMGCPVYFYDRAKIDDAAQRAGFEKWEIAKIRGSGQDYVAVFHAS